MDFGYDTDLDAWVIESKDIVSDENKNTLWLVGQFKGREKGIVWEFQGIFNTEPKAIAACVKSNYFVAKVTLNEKCPEDTQTFKEMYYPVNVSITKIGGKNHAKTKTE